MMNNIRHLFLHSHPKYNTQSIKNGGQCENNVNPHSIQTHTHTPHATPILSLAHQLINVMTNTKRRVHNKFYIGTAATLTHTYVRSLARLFVHSFVCLLSYKLTSSFCFASDHTKASDFFCL